jgi:hypothetical protein
VEAGQFEEALNICALCKSASLGRDVDVELIHEKYALSLFQKGDFDGCVQHYIAGKSNVVAVLMLFPDLVPVVLQTTFSNVSRQGQSRTTSSRGGAAMGSGTPSAWGPMNRLSGVVLSRAAVALVAFCEHHRPLVSMC